MNVPVGQSFTTKFDHEYNPRDQLRSSQKGRVDAALSRSATPSPTPSESAIAPSPSGSMQNLDQCCRVITDATGPDDAITKALALGLKGDLDVEAINGGYLVAQKK